MNVMTKELLEQLYGKWCTETMSAAEWQQFSGMAGDPGCKPWLEEIIGAALEQPEFDGLLSAQENRLAYERLLHKLSPVAQARLSSPVKQMAVSLRRWWVAASVLFMFGIAAYLWSNRNTSNSPAVAVKTPPITPGRDGAILTLADGSQVLLDTIQNGVVALQAGATAHVVNGSLVYEADSAHSFVYNTITTPKGRQFQLTLPDGTRVWLNAASAIRFPTAFTTARNITVTGEVYMEVARNASKPFMVRTAASEIQVLGTSFNINAYPNEDTVRTTLLEGSVRIKANGQHQLLTPGEQSQVTGNGYNVVIKDADTERALAWKNGYFDFDGVPLKQMMRQLERWYDIEVVYTTNMPDVELFGKMTSDVSISGLLTVLEKLGIHATLDGRKLMITESKK
jgi:ferric-dicitrate binding protein FerR (iron transport regulator)